ncbi:MAG: ankyrin repeat domain-containing protein [Dehalococcoidia bacterium]
MRYRVLPALCALLAAGALGACVDPRAAPGPSRTPAGVVTGTAAPTATPAVAPKAGTATPQPPAAGALIEAAATGDLAAVRALIAAGAAVDERDARGRTPLFRAAQNGHLPVARALLAAGADVNAADEAADTPYYVAALARHAELTGVLLDAGADRVGTRAYGGTPLIAISERGWVDVAREILRRPRIPVDHVNNLGWTALIEAIILGRGGPDHQEIVRLLLEYGADPNIADGQGRSPLTLARERGYLEIVAMLEAAGAR